MRRLGIVALALVAMSLGCSSDEDGPSATADPLDARLLHSVMIGSEEVISEEASAAVDTIGLQLRAMGPALAALTESYVDPAVSRDEWTAASDQPLAALFESVRALDGLVERAPEPVRDAFRPYVQGWNAVYESQRGLLAAVRSRDAAAEQAALEAQGTALAELRDLDDARMARVAEEFGQVVADELLSRETAG